MFIARVWCKWSERDGHNLQVRLGKGRRGGGKVRERMGGQVWKVRESENERQTDKIYTCMCTASSRLQGSRARGQLYLERTKSKS